MDWTIQLLVVGRVWVVVRSVVVDLAAQLVTVEGTVRPLVVDTVAQLWVGFLFVVVVDLKLQ